MQYYALAIGIAVLALLLAWQAAAMLLRSNWLLGWLRGSAGLALLAGAGVIGVVGYDLHSYQMLPADRPLLTLTFQADGDKDYRVTLLEGSEMREVRLQGDLWQLDVRLLRWKSLAALIGLQPGYRLERLSGRFLSIEEQQLASHTEVSLAQSPYGVDFWRWLRRRQGDLYVVTPEAQRVTYLPLADGAAYSVSLSAAGLLAQPLNQAANEALANWR